MPQVSVFMAAYNAADYIKQAIQSVLNQTFNDFELIIVNDGSTDNTVDIIKSFDDKRIILVNNDQNKGLVYTRNLALKYATGKYLAIHDSDDISIPTRLEIQVNKLENEPNLAVIGSRALIIDKNGILTGEKLDVINGSDYIKSILFFENTFVHSSIMMRTSVFKEVNGYETYPGAEDYDIFLRISLLYPLDNLEEYLVQYRIHSTNFSIIEKQLLETQLLKIKAKQLENLNIRISEQEIIDSRDNLKQFESLYKQIIYANRKMKIYEVNIFEALIFKKWQSLIIEKHPKNAFFLFFKKPFFNRSYMNKHLIKKALKLSFG